MKWNEADYKYPIVRKDGSIGRGNKKAQLRSHGIPDITKDLGKALKVLNEPGSKARVKWEGDKEWTQFGD